MRQRSGHQRASATNMMMIMSGIDSQTKKFNESPELIKNEKPVPGGAIEVIRGQITRVASQGGATLGLTFIVGLLASLWSANAGMKSLFEALNLVYNEKAGYFPAPWGTGELGNPAKWNPSMLVPVRSLQPISRRTAT
jgi:hypothetical protein